MADKMHSERWQHTDIYSTEKLGNFLTSAFIPLPSAQIPSSALQICHNFSLIILEHHQRYVYCGFCECLCNVSKEKTRLARRSIFGYFCRRCFVSYVKLSYGGLSKLREDYQYWCSEGRKAGYEPIPKDNLTSRCCIVDSGCLLTKPASYLIHKTQVDKKTWAKPDTYAAYVPLIFGFHSTYPRSTDGRRREQWATRASQLKAFAVSSSNTSTTSRIRMC